MMGSICSSTEIVVHGSFDMAGVPADVAAATFRDIEAAPSFIPLFVSIAILRGEPAQVGTCWLETQRVGNGEIVLKKTITNQSDDPFTQRALIEFVDSSSWTMPDFLSTYSLVIEPLSTDDGSPSCSIRWTDAIISKGFLSRFLSILCVPCLKRTWIAQTQEMWQGYYEEALRRTNKAVQTSDGSAPTER